MSSKGDLNLPITSEDFTKAATDSAGRNFDRLQGKVDRFSTSKPSKEIDDFSRLVAGKLKDGESAFTSIEREIDSTKARIASLRQEFAGSGNANVGVFGDLKAAQRDLKALESIAGDMRGEFHHASVEADSIGEALPQLVAAAGPLLAPVVAGSLLGLLAGGGLALGIVGQLNGPGVRSALTGFETDAKSALTGATSAFAPTIVSSLGVLDKGVVTFLGDLKPGLDALAPELSKLSGEVVTGLVKAGPQIAEAWGRSGPVIDALGTGIGTLISSTGTFFAEISAGSSAAAGEITGLATNIGGTIRALGAVINVVDQIDGAVSKVNATGAKAPGVLGGIWSSVQTGIDNAINPLGHAWESVMGQFGSGDLEFKRDADGLRVVSTAGLDAARGGKQAADDFTALTGAMSSAGLVAASTAATLTDKLLGQLMAGDQATLHWHESLTNLSGVLKSNKDSLKINSKAGQANREAILGAVSANVANYDAMINSGSSAASAAKKYDDNTAALRRQLLKAGLLPGAIDKIIGKYGKVPSDVNTAVAITGLTTAINDLADLERTIHGIPTAHTTTVHVNVSQSDLNAVKRKLAQANANAAGTAWGAMIDPSHVGITDPVRDVSVTSHLTSVLNLDGQVLDRRTSRVVSRHAHRQKVGVR